MKQKTQIDESVISRLKKILALAERGERGEANAARALLEQQLLKYNLTLDDLASECKKMREFKYSNRHEKKLLANLFIHQFGSKSELAKNARFNPTRKFVFVEMTDLEYAEFAPVWEYYRLNFSRELKNTEETFLRAFILKFNLFDISPKDDESEPTPKQTMSYDEIKRILGLAASISTNPFIRMLNK